VSQTLERSTPRSRLWADRIAARLVGTGGFAVVASLAGILLFLLWEVAPLFASARVEVEPLRAGPARPAGLEIDPHATHVAELGQDGILRVRALASGELVLERVLLENPAFAARVPGRPLFGAADSSGRVAAAELLWSVAYGERERSVTPSLGEPVQLELETAGAALRAFALERSASGWLAAGLLSDGTLQFVRLAVEINAFTQARSERVERFSAAAPPDATQLLIHAGRQRVFAATPAARLLQWEIAASELRPAPPIELPGPATALAALGGGRSLIAGHADGSLSQIFEVPFGEARLEWTRVRGFPALPAAIERIESSARDRSFLASAADGSLGLYHATSGRLLWSGRAAAAGPLALALGARGDVAIAAGEGAAVALRIDSPHPDSAWRSFLARVWYEDAPQPEFVWQSTGGSDAFEPKLSLVPLLVGTLKGTLYALLLAVPLGVGGAIFVSQFMHPRLAGVVKPTVELMASLPSVVLGFAAGLWLAPRLERILPGLLAMLLAFPLVALAGAALWRALPRAWTQRWPPGSELALHAVLLALGAAACVELSPWLELQLFAGDTSSWLQHSTGLYYDQRNALVAGIAMGFAVIPIVLSLSDEALSNVPPSLSAASLALGATRWQTVARIVLPAASPGLFAAVMIGLGRAIGETMIVLMATGNTPILGWSPFDGFRTLSANIAVEIPEAPHGGTLYRTLFASALGLFALTFALNTAAELVRERLRRRYAGS
jgi:phosphate transport system permease protein